MYSKIFIYLLFSFRELDLHRTKLMDFDQVCKLGNIKTLTSLNLMENGIEEIKLPECEPNEKLEVFASLEHLNLFYNPIWNEVDAFNELDKLPKLKRLSKTPHLKSDFDEMFARAVAFISGLQMLNKAQITAGERRGAEYDIWKKYAAEWLQASSKPETLNDFYKKHRSYALLLKSGCNSHRNDFYLLYLFRFFFISRIRLSGRIYTATQCQGIKSNKNTRSDLQDGRGVGKESTTHDNSTNIAWSHSQTFSNRGHQYGAVMLRRSQISRSNSAYG